ncbi:hypothetical protein DWV16_16185 [Anaerotruncus sp. AF02-27]|uniref:hypothetical protein n=1 Tax=Anaerotruncus sp. AF02-27 TaxID=2292191 RepID=UPI000E4FD4FC|nr:hypothetical protein [Anaerotruncus sp. AF02-27]RGX53764.1 hypothetical protein DWV16_16185 [Anaerotruncus sp. AF02-27]
MLKTMYPAMPFSPQALLTQAIGAADTIIPVDNIDAFPAAPNLAVIGTDENAETICYAAKTDSALSGCVRGVEGTAKEWQAGEVIARNFTAADFDAVRQNIEGLDQGKADKVANATAGNLAGLDADGNPTNSGKKPDDFADKVHSHTSYALKAPSPTAGNLATLDANGNPVDSGKVPDDYVLAEAGKGLSTNDYTTAEKEKLAGIAENANNYVHPATHSAQMIDETDTRKFVTPDEKAAWNGKADPSDLITITLPVASWVKDSTREMWTQAVTHSSIVNDVRIGISVDDDTQLALMDAGVTLRIDNNNGTATAKAFGAIPESNITVQLTLTPVEVVA